MLMEETRTQHVLHIAQDVGETERRRLADVLERCGMLITTRPKATFTAKGLETDLPKLLRGTAENSASVLEQHRDVLDCPLAAQALGGMGGCGSMWQYVEQAFHMHTASCWYRIDSLY